MVDDTHAHAWVEYYQDGVGWLPFETTPSYLDIMNKAEDYQNISGVSGGSSQDDQDMEQQDEEQQEEEDNAEKQVSRMKLFGSDAKALYDLDQENAARVYTVPSPLANA